MCISLALLSATPSPVAGQGTPAPKPGAKPSAARPSAELLEFLASFEDEQGRWQDPLLFDSAPVSTSRIPRQEASHDRR